MGEESVGLRLALSFFITLHPPSRNFNHLRDSIVSQVQGFILRKSACRVSSRLESEGAMERGLLHSTPCRSPSHLTHQTHRISVSKDFRAMAGFSLGRGALTRV